MIKEAIRIGKLNTNEIPGTKSNPDIMKLAEIAGVKHIYKNDDIAWCAVVQSAICLLANKELPFTGYNRLRAKSFLRFGVPVKEPMLGDIMVFSRTGGGHVGMYIGEDKNYYHIAGSRSIDCNLSYLILIEILFKSYCNNYVAIAFVYFFFTFSSDFFYISVRRLYLVNTHLVNTIIFLII